MEPASWSAHTMLYLSLSADLEGSAPDDHGWLDRAAEVCACVAALLDDRELSHAETRRARALAAGVHADAEPLTGVPDDDAEARCAALVAVLRALHHHLELVTAARG